MSIAKKLILLLPIVYLAGVAICVGSDFYTFRQGGGDAGFPVKESLEYASLWPLRLTVIFG